MNMKSLLSLALLCAVGLAVAQSEECFPGKSLEELQIMRDEYLDSIKVTPQWKKKKIAKERCEAAHSKFTQAKMCCGLHKSNGWTAWIAAWAMGATEKDCDLVETYEKEFSRSGKLLVYANEQIGIANPELKALCDCIKKREYDALEIPEKTVQS